MHSYKIRYLVTSVKLDKITEKGRSTPDKIGYEKKVIC